MRHHRLKWQLVQAVLVLAGTAAVLPFSHAADMQYQAAINSPSRTDADRKIKSGALEINGARWTELSHPADATLTLRLGKKWKKVTIT